MQGKTTGFVGGTPQSKGTDRGELHQHLGHLITTLTAADVNNCIRVTVLRKGLGNDRLAAAEGTGDGASTTLDDAR